MPIVVIVPPGEVRPEKVRALHEAAEAAFVSFCRKAEAGSLLGTEAMLAWLAATEAALCQIAAEGHHAEVMSLFIDRLSSIAGERVDPLAEIGPRH